MTTSNLKLSTISPGLNKAETRTIPVRKIAVIIPCYNEEQTIEKVVKDFRKELPAVEIFVCDNNSTDKTAYVAKKNGAKVLKEYRQGKGHAVLNLFRKVDADVFIMVDGDDTYPAKQVVEMLEELIAFNLDMVVGDRLSNGTYKQENKRKFHNFGNSLMRKLINNFFRSDLNDILSGYRIFSRRFIENYATLAEGFELETDLSIFALHYNMKIKEIPVTYQDRPEGSFSKLNTFRDGWRVISTFLNLYRFYKPLSFFTYLSTGVFLLSILLGSFPIYEYFQFSYIHKVPTAILAGFLSVSALLLFICGLILDSIAKIDQKNMQLKLRNSG